MWALERAPTADAHTRRAARPSTHTPHITFAHRRELPDLLNLVRTNDRRVLGGAGERDAQSEEAPPGGGLTAAQRGMHDAVEECEAAEAAAAAAAEAAAAEAAAAEAAAAAAAVAAAAKMKRAWWLAGTACVGVAVAAAWEYAF